MAAALNDEIADLAVRHQVGVSRLSTGVLKRLLPILDKADDEIVAKLLSRGATLEGSITSKRLQSLLDAIRGINHDAHVAVGKVLRPELRNVAKYEADFQHMMLSKTLPVALDIVSPSVEMLNAVATAQPFQGKLLKEWLSELEAGKARRVRDAVRLGMVQGEPVDQIVRRIRGTRALNYRDGVMEIGRRGAEAMTRTAVAHTTSAARQAVYEANSEIIKAETWVSTLDARTCPTCQGRDGQQYDLGKGPQTPAHIGCRCVRVPVTKSWRELGFDVDELPPSTRASMNGQVPATQTYGEWLRKQPAAVQDEALGPTRGALFRSGGVKVDRFTNRAGDELTLNQLKAKDAQAFEKAGLTNPIKPPKGEPMDAIAVFLNDPTAQRNLLTELIGDIGHHIDVVEGVIRARGWSIKTDPALAIRHYTGTGYYHINSRMRAGGPTLKDRQFTALTASGIDQLPTHSGTVWRAPFKRRADADGLWNRAQQGSELDLGNQLQSFSVEQAIAANWSGEAGLVVKIERPRVGAYIEELSQFPGEKEVLLPPGARYRVAGRYTEAHNGRELRVIELEVIEDD